MNCNAHHCQMEQDAERYRWLRAQHNPPFGLPVAQVVWKRGSDPRGEWVNLIDSADLDRHVDEGIARDFPLLAQSSGEHCLHGSPARQGALPDAKDGAA